MYESRVVNTALSLLILLAYTMAECPRIYYSALMSCRTAKHSKIYVMEQTLSNKYDQLCDTLLIVEEFVGRITNERTQMDIAVKLCPYVDNLKKLVKENPSAVVETIAHDYIGLKDEEDEDFLPRLA